MLESLFDKVAGLTPILKNICQRLLLHCTHTTHCYLSVFLYIQHLLPHQYCYYSEAVARKCSIKKGVLRNFSKFTGKHLCQSLFFNKVAGLRPVSLLKKTLAQAFFCEFCKIFKDTFRYRIPLMAASVNISDVCFWFKFKRFQRI